MSKVVDLLGDKTSYYLDHTCKTIDKSLIYIPHRIPLIKSGLIRTET